MRAPDKCLTVHALCLASVILCVLVWLLFTHEDSADTTMQASDHSFTRMDLQYDSFTSPFNTLHRRQVPPTQQARKDQSDSEPSSHVQTNLGLATDRSFQLNFGLGYLFPPEYEQINNDALERAINQGDGLAAFSLGTRQLQSGRKKEAVLHLEQALVLGQTKASLLLARHYEMEGEILPHIAWRLIAEKCGHEHDFRDFPQTSNYGGTVLMQQILERINRQRLHLGKDAIE